MPVSVYWIHHKDHTDVFNQGYIGVSNNTEKRFAKHKTHVNNNKHMRNPIVAAKTAATKKGIATRGFGWKHSEETRKKLSKNAGNKGVGRKVVVNGISFISQTAAAKHFGVHIRTFKKRFKLGIL